MRSVYVFIPMENTGIKIACVAIGLFALLSTQLARAAPDLQSAETIDNVRIFKDHQKPLVFYYQKMQKRLVENENVPEFNYQVNRYIGKTITEDTDEFRVRGAIKFQTTSDFGETSYASILEQLKAKYPGKVELLPAPISNSYNKLVYATINVSETEEKAKGELEGGLVKSEKPKNSLLATEKQRFTIGLSGHDADFFWQNFEKNNLILSLAYGWSVSGVKKNAEDIWDASTYEISNTTPIKVSMKEFPALFKKNELWQNIDVAHSTITVMCYDFINLKKSPFYYVNVELRFNTLRNQSYEEKIRFTQDNEQYEAPVRFKLVNSIKDGYEYRVSRMTLDGDKTTSAWIKTTQAAIDVSLTAEELAPLNIEEEEIEDETL